MNGFYSVFASGGKKVADCGSLQDATTLVAMKGDGHYYQFTPYPGDIIDVSSNNQLPGQQGLPSAHIKLEDAQQQLELREGYAEIFVS
jgi:hypothetical protein